MTNRLKRDLRNATILCDGPIGTSLYARGMFLVRCYDELNLSRPELMRTVHEEYLQAGAEMIETTAFRANALRLQRYGLADQVVEINRARVKSARKAVNQRADEPSGKPRIPGAVRPLGARLEPLGKIGLEEAREAFTSKSSRLAEGGADMLLIEDRFSIKCGGAGPSCGKSHGPLAADPGDRHGR